MATTPEQPPSSSLDETAIIQRYFVRRTAGTRHDIRCGIGDDGAVLAPPTGQELVVVMDAIVEGVHFPPAIPAAAIGHRALAVNLSDLAAMGARPAWCTLALSIGEADENWLSGFAAGFFALADRHGIELVGGDTVRGPLMATVTAHGFVAAGTAIRRQGARPGDGVYVSGSPGEAVAGRLLLADPEHHGAAGDHLRRRFLFPEPRVFLGRSLIGIATAMLDVSDGLDVDLGRLAAASSVGLDLAVDDLPLSAELREVAGPRAVESALTGGDDYELCFTARPAQLAALLTSGHADLPPVTRIGTVIAGQGVRWTAGGTPYAVPDSAFRHF